MNRSQILRLGRARTRIWSGHYQGAMPALEILARETEAAHAVLAQIYGFLFDWNRTLRHAGAFLANPLAVGPDNLFTDMVELTGRAARETRDWRRLHTLCEAAIENIERHYLDSQGRPRYIAVVDNLKSYSMREGTAPHELVRIFGYRSDLDNLSETQKRGYFERAVAAIDTDCPDLRDRPAERLRHQLSLALVYEQWEAAFALYQSDNPALYHLEYVVPLIKHLVRAERTHDARAMLERHWPHWMASRAQVLPVVLLFDEELQTLADAEMCGRILRAPRAT